jgi:hypothetical protein
MGRSVSHTDLLSEYEAPYILGSSFRRKVAEYIERCHLEDGGYFFARVPPSNGLDTYFAVRSLFILGVKPERPEAIASFFLNDVAEGMLGGITGIFITVEVLNELGQLPDDVRSYAWQQIMLRQNKAGGFGALDNIYIEVPSELEETYRAARILRTVGADFDERRIADFVSSKLNLDGGYGREGRSTLASTYYATAIYRLLGTNAPTHTDTLKYLRETEERWRASFDSGRVNFIEDLYWLVGSLDNLGEKCNFRDRAIRFVMACQRVNGGFARATIMGIPNLEYTFYALSILSEVGALQRFS